MEGWIMQTCIIRGCGISWYMPSGFDAQRKSDHIPFFCPNGHSQYYVEKNEEEKLKAKVYELERKLSGCECDLKSCEGSRKALKGEITKLKRGVR